MARRRRSIGARARIAQGWSLGFYIAGIAAIGSGVLVAGIVAAATGTAAGFTVAAIIGGTGVVTGGLGLWESRRFGRRARTLEAAISEQRLYTLAEEHDGVLRAVDAANGLSLMRSEAEELLDQMVDEVRVSMQVTDEGEIQYIFRELASGSEPRVRVMDPDAEEVAVEADTDSSQRSKH
jgi:hypothetical protein